VIAVPDHCDKCGTELHPDQYRHHGYRVESPDEGHKEGQLCADCFVDLERWLEAE